MNKLIKYLFQDWETNKETSAKMRLILLLFRSTNLFNNLPNSLRVISSIYRNIYILITEWILGVELPHNTQIGSKLRLIHGVGLVINQHTKIGVNCTIRHSTTIGNKKLTNGSYSASPIIGNNVDIGSNSVIIGAITIGDNAVIGAGSVVVKNVPPGAIVAGNPAKIIRMSKFEENAMDLEDITTANLALYQ